MPGKRKIEKGKDDLAVEYADPDTEIIKALYSNSLQNYTSQSR